MPPDYTQAKVNEAHADWNLAAPAVVPEPTVWPAGLSLAISLLLWGLVSSLIITCVGGVLFIICLAGWIADIRHERKTE
jgi:hypothetical protein